MVLHYYTSSEAEYQFNDYDMTSIIWYGLYYDQWLLRHYYINEMIIMTIAWHIIVM